MALISTLPVLGLNLSAAAQFARLKSRLETTNRRIADADLFIASIALAHSATAITGNRNHYADIETLPIEDWIRR